MLRIDLNDVNLYKFNQNSCQFWKEFSLSRCYTKEELFYLFTFRTKNAWGVGVNKWLPVKYKFLLESVAALYGPAS